MKMVCQIFSAGANAQEKNQLLFVSTASAVRHTHFICSSGFPRLHKSD